MRQPIKLLPYFGNTENGGNNIARFKGLSVNCSTIGESWELSTVPGKQSIVANGDNAGMDLQLLVEQQKGKLIGEDMYSLYGAELPLNVKLVDNEGKLAVSICHIDNTTQSEFQYVPDSNVGLQTHSKPLVSGPCFSVCLEAVEGERILKNGQDSFMGLLCLGGEGQLTVDGVSTSVRKGETLLLPASVDEFSANGALSFLTVVARIPY